MDGDDAGMDMGDLGGMGDLSSEPGGGTDDVVDATVEDDGWAPADGEDVVDADFVDVTADGTVLSTDTGLAVVPPTVTVTAVDGEPVDDGLPPLPGMDDEANPGRADRDADVKDYGQQRHPGAGGGGARSGPGAWLPWKRKGPRMPGAKFGGQGGSGGSGGGRGSLIGSLLTITVAPSANVGNGASIASPNVSPAIGGIAATGNPPTGRTGSRRPASTGRRRTVR